MEHPTARAFREAELAAGSTDEGSLYDWMDQAHTTRKSLVDFSLVYDSGTRIFKPDKLK